MTATFVETDIIVAPRRRMKRRGPPPVVKNKLIVLLLDTFGFGVIGLDRIYLRCYLAGVVKFATLVLGFLFMFSGNLTLMYIGGMLLTISFLWNIVDTLSLYYNAIIMDRGVPFIFCRPDRPVIWDGYQNLVDAKNLSLLLIVIFIIFNGFGAYGLKLGAEKMARMY